MGDMADEALDRACTECEEYDRFQNGEFTPEEAYDMGFVNEFGAEEPGPKGWNTLFPDKKVLRCKNCGSTNVYWGQYPSGKWFLFTDGKPHVCNKGDKNGREKKH